MRANPPTRVALSGCAEDSDSLRALMRRFPRAGRVEWIGLRPAHRAAVVVVPVAEAVAAHGLTDDRYAKTDGDRQVTLIQLEHLQAVAALLGQAGIDPANVRRNIVVSGINLLALKGGDFRVGVALLRWTGLCHPCSRMEAVLGRGGYNAMRGHGGITAAVVQSGAIRVGDEVVSA